MNKTKKGAGARLMEYVERERRIIIFQTELAIKFDRENPKLAMLRSLSNYILVGWGLIIGLIVMMNDPGQGANDMFVISFIPVFLIWLTILSYQLRAMKYNKLSEDYRSSLKKNHENGIPIRILDISEWTLQNHCSICADTPPCIDCVLVPSDFEPVAKEVGTTGGE